MRTWPDNDGGAIGRHLQQLRPRNPVTVKVYRCILSGFQRFVVQHHGDPAVSQSTIEAWLRERTTQWPFHLVLHRSRIINRFLDFLVTEGSIPANPLAQLRARYAQRTTTPIVRALCATAPEEALEALRPLPCFASFLGRFMLDHIALMRALGYRYHAEAARFLRFDRFLQGRPDLTDQPPALLLREWAADRPTLAHAWQCEALGHDLAKAWRRLDPDVAMPRSDRRLWRQVKQQQRRPYIYTQEEVRHLLNTARQFPSPRAPLRPLTLYTMLVLAYCAGLRLGEIVRLELADVDLAAGEIAVRDTKFFKSRTLPLAPSVVAALREYLDARRRTGAPQEGSCGLFWHEHPAGRYSYVMTEKLLVRVLRASGLKPNTGRVGPRVHDLRHAFVGNRMLAWYREGINPQARLPYLATYLGHKDINSTLVYLSATQELLEQASERFRAFGAHNLHAEQGIQQ